MKKLYFLGFALFGLIGNYSGQITWDGGGADNNFSTANNWSTNQVPGTADDIIFDGTISNKNCNFDGFTPGDGSININDFTIQSNYTGTIDGLSCAIYLTGNFSQAGGTFVSTDQDIGIEGNISFTGGTFTHNGGTVSMWIGGGSTSSISGNIIFNALNIISLGGSGSERIVNFGTSTTTDLVLSHSDGSAGRLYSYQGNISILGSLTLINTNTGIPTSNSGTFTFSGAGPITIVGSAVAARSKLPNIVINTTGAISSTGQLNIQGNWTGTQGTLTAGTSIQNFYGTGATINGSAAMFNNLVIQTGASVTFPAAQEVLINRNFTNNGTVTFPSTNILGFSGGTTGQTISGTGFTAGSIRARSGSRTITLSTAVTIVDFLEVQDNVTFTAGNNLTLRSNASGTARFAELGSGASITGNVTVQTFIPGGSTGWTNMGVRGVSGETIKSWDTYSASAGVTGIPMTCSGCDYDEESLGSHFVSIQDWTEATQTYNEMTAADALDPGKGFWVYVGDATSSTSGLTLINNGPLVTGQVNFQLSVQSFGENLVANPYASPISWNSVFNFGINSAILATSSIYVFNPDLGITTSWNGATSSPGGAGSITDNIPGGQGFYVDGGIDGINITFDESAKVSATDPLLKPATTENFEAFRLKIEGGNSEWDATTIFIHDSATPLYGKWDARKIFSTPGYFGFPGPYTKYTSISSKDAQGKDYAINAIPLLTQDVTIPILAKVSTSGTYTISAKDFQDIDGCIMLKDNLTNTTKDLKTSNYVFTISDTTSAPRFELLLCRDKTVNPDGIFEESKSNTIFINQNQAGPYVVTQFEQNTKATISVYNVIGQKLVNDITVNGTNNTTHLNIDLHNQVVLIKVVTGKESITKKMVTH